MSVDNVGNNYVKFGSTNVKVAKVFKEWLESYMKPSKKRNE